MQCYVGEFYKSVSKRIQVWDKLDEEFGYFIWRCTYSTRSPLVTLLSRRSQSDRRTSYLETGVAHRITFSFSYFLFSRFLFINFILDIIYGVLYLVNLLAPELFFLNFSTPVYKM